MTPDIIDEAVVCMAILAGLLLVLGIGGFIADYILPHIPFVERYLDNLPEWDEEEDW